MPSNTKIKKFSRGMTMKLSISVALSHKTKFYCLLQKEKKQNERFNKNIFYSVESTLKWTIAFCILINIVAIIGLVRIPDINGKRRELPVFCYVMSLVGTVGVTLTMLVTAFFLAPTTVANWMSLFANINFFLHLVNPILSIVVFVFFLRSTKIDFKATFTGSIPMVLYAIYYVGNAVGHSINNVVPKEYDWYGFLVKGASSGVVIIPLLILITYVISFVL